MSSPGAAMTPDGADAVISTARRMAMRCRVIGLTDPTRHRRSTRRGFVLSVEKCHRETPLLNTWHQIDYGASKTRRGFAYFLGNPPASIRQRQRRGHRCLDDLARCAPTANAGIRFVL